jgi:hypothetical protein
MQLFGIPWSVIPAVFGGYNSFSVASNAQWKYKIIWLDEVNMFVPWIILGHAVTQLVEAQRYKPKGRGFDSRWGHWDFSLT